VPSWCSGGSHPKVEGAVLREPSANQNRRQISFLDLIPRFQIHAFESLLVSPQLGAIPLCLLVVLLVATPPLFGHVIHLLHYRVSLRYL
jgi:hypothetical protein